MYKIILYIYLKSDCKYDVRTVLSPMLMLTLIELTI